MAEVLVIGKKISEMGLVNEVTGEEKIPTSALGDKAVTTGQLLTYVNNNGVAQWGRIGGDINNQVDLQNQFTQERDTLKSYTQEQVSQQQVALQNHIQDQGNPHNVTKEQVGLGLVDNTADMDKPVSTAVQEALSLKADQTYVDDSLASKTHNSLLGRDAAGAHPASAISYGSINQEDYNNGLDSIGEMLAISAPQDGMRVFVKSYHVGHNKGGGYFTWDATSTAVQDNAVIFGTSATGRWVRDRQDVMNAFDFGLHPTELNATELFTRINNNTTAREVVIDKLVFNLSNGLVLTRSDLHLNIHPECEFRYTTALPSGVAGIEWKGGINTEYVVSQDVLQFSTTITLSEPTSDIKVGDMLFLTSTDSPYAGARDFEVSSELVEIAAVSGAKLTLRKPVSIRFLAASTARLKSINWIKNPKLTGGKFYADFYTPVAPTTNGVRMTYAMNGLIENTSSEEWGYSCFLLTRCFNTDVLRNYCDIKHAALELDYGCVLEYCDSCDVEYNEFKSTRAAIDLTRLSKDCNVRYNKTMGSINTHTAHYCNMSENNITEGGMLIRGPYNSVDKNNIKSLVKASTLGYEEAAIAGPCSFTRNKFEGKIFGVRVIYHNGTVFEDNEFNVVGADGRNYLFLFADGDRFNTHPNSSAETGVSIKRNKFLCAEDSGVTKGFSTAYLTAGLLSLQNTYIDDNIFKGMPHGLHVSPMSSNTGRKNLSIQRNHFYCSGATASGIAGVNTGVLELGSVDLCFVKDNFFYGTGATGSLAISKSNFRDENNDGVFYTRNTIINYDIGIRARGGVYTNSSIADNTFIGVNTKYDVSTVFPLPEEIVEPQPQDLSL